MILKEEITIRKSKLTIVMMIVYVFSIFIQPKIHTQAALTTVHPPNIETTLNPTDDRAKRIKEILLNTNKYALTSWWEEKNFRLDDEYINFGGTTEHFIRHPAAMSLGLSTSLAFDLYDENITGVSTNEALEKTKLVIASLAYNHKSNKTGGWGDHWQSAHWAHFAGLAGWLLWDEFPATEQEYIRKMVEYEANRFINQPVPYWKNPDGTENYVGDTKAEENAWNAQVLQLATAMMPNHVNWELWMKAQVYLMISAAARPSDLTNDTVYHGKPISEWINGYNINEDGTVINHGFIHPDYMEFIVFNNTAAITATLANQPTPKAAFFNSDIVYKAFVDLSFESPPYEEPGGTIYIEDSSDIYFPQGNDWGYGRRMNFATIDAFADAFGYDKNASKPGSYWEDLHAQIVLIMQSRHEDGRTYSDNLEDHYIGKEEWVAHHAAWSWLAKYVANSGKFEITNNSVEPEFQRLAGVSRFHTAIEISKEGWENAETVVIVRSDQFPDALTGVPLAAQKDAPILLTYPNELPVITKDEIKRLGAKNVIILGGEAAVSKNVEKSLKNIVDKVKRISGNDRFETARKIAKKLDGNPRTAIVAYGYDFPDALAASYYAAKNGYPIILTDTNIIPKHAEKVLKNMNQTIVVGGEKVIGQEVYNRLPNPTRVDGNHRYDTAAKLITEFNITPERITIANGYSFADALTGAVLATKYDAPLLLVEENNAPWATRTIFEKYSINQFKVFGGETVISNQVINQLRDQYINFTH